MYNGFATMPMFLSLATSEPDKCEDPPFEHSFFDRGNCRCFLTNNAIRIKQSRIRGMAIATAVDVEASSSSILPSSFLEFDCTIDVGTCVGTPIGAAVIDVLVGKAVGDRVTIGLGVVGACVGWKDGA